MKSMTLDRPLSQQSPLAMQTLQQGKMLVAIDPGVEDPQKLAAGVQPGAEVFILDPNRDGVEQIAQVLKESANPTSVHLISHGFPGGIKLGATELSLDNLERYAGILQTWSKTLTGASLLLYGCQVALGEAGCRFLERLQQLTGANLAASTQKVGSADRGGSWSLDYQIGQVIDELAFLPQVREAYSGVFVPQVSVTASATEVAEGESITFNITAAGEELPAEGIVITTSSIFPEGDQFDFNVFDDEDPTYVSGLEEYGDVVTPEGEERILWTLTEPEASITLPVFDDIIAEPDENFTLEVLPGDGYTVSPDAGSSTVTLSDEVVDGEGPTVSFSIEGSTEDLEFIESEGGTITATFTVDGEIPEGGLEVTVDGNTAGALGDFELFDTAGNPLFTSTGITGVPTNSTFDGSGFAVVLTENTATLTIDIADNGPNEGLEETTFTLLNGENYEVDPQVNETTITIDDGDEGQFFGGEEDDVFEIGSPEGYNGSNDTVFAGAGDDLIDTSTAGSSLLYGQLGDDTFYLGNEDQASGGSGADTFYLGNENRASGGSGGDTFYLGNENRASGGNGDDVFYALGSESTITGGTGADAFWIVSGDLQDLNTITDFELGTDVLGVGGLGLGFADLTFSEVSGNTVITALEEDVALLTGITPNQLSASNFVFG